MNSFRAWCVIVVLALAGTATAQDRPYTEGPVTVVTAVKVMDGQDENYMKYLAKTWRQSMEASKEADIVAGYRVFNASPRRADDADLYLVVTYPNMAMLDGMDAKMDPIMAKVMKMNLAQREAAGKRNVMRSILGSEMLREMVFAAPWLRFDTVVPRDAAREGLSRASALLGECLDAGRRR